MTSTLFGPGTEGVGSDVSLNQPISVAFLKEQWLYKAYLCVYIYICILFGGMHY
jgi:hypothetical protein